MNRCSTRVSVFALLLAVGLPLAASSGYESAKGSGPSGAGAALAAARADDTDLPIRRITLYRSGVGYFERSGAVAAGDAVQMRFNTDQINDILKSMVVLVDPAKGRLDAISYGSKEPLQRRLASFGVNIADNPTIPQLLEQLRGADIRVVVAGEAISGTILGVEKRTVPPKGEAPAYDAPHVNLVGATGVRSIAVTDISSFEVLDPALAAELGKALAALAEYRADRTKTVDLRFSGDASVPVTLAYVHEMPVWKTSYRLVLADAADKGAQKSGPVIQGWAIVENTTDQDWNNVSLSLVSGRPVSFQMDLYEPLYTFRPFVPVPTIPGVMPRSYAAGSEGALQERLRAAMAPPEPAAPAMDLGQIRGKAMAEGGRSPFRDDRDSEDAGYEGMDASRMSDYAAAAQASAAEVGEVFQYRLDAPVTIERQRSAMLPILNSTLEGRRVSIFNLNDASRHPMRGVEITNDSGLQLLPGPIAVFDGAAYAGDAQIGHVSKGEKRLLAYAVDVDVHALTEPEQTYTVTKLRIIDGAFEQTVKQLNRITYAFDNKDPSRDRTIIVEHPKLHGWELVEPSKPTEQTQDLYRFDVTAPAGKTAGVVVRQERVDRQRVGIESIELQTIVAFHTEGKVSKAVLDAVRELAQRNGVVQQVQREIQEIDRQLREITADQVRIRENMARIDSTSQLYGRYMTRLNEQEDEIDSKTTAREEKETRLKALQQDYANYVRSLNVE